MLSFKSFCPTLACTTPLKPSHNTTLMLLPSFMTNQSMMLSLTMIRTLTMNNPTKLPLIINYLMTLSLQRYHLSWHLHPSQRTISWQISRNTSISTTSPNNGIQYINIFHYSTPHADHVSAYSQPALLFWLHANVPPIMTKCTYNDYSTLHLPHTTSEFTKRGLPPNQTLLTTLQYQYLPHMHGL